MFKWVKKYPLFALTAFLFALVLFIFYLDYRDGKKEFVFAMLDVGQGDALFIQSPTGTQILIDSGPPGRILGKLSRAMPLFDRSLDAIIVTNPDQDHIGGFLDVLDSYQVGKFFEPGTFNDSKTYQNLKEEIKNRKIPQFLARKGMTLDLGGGAKLEILFPDRDVSLWDTNDGSIVTRLTYGNTSILLMGDSTLETEEMILKSNPKEKIKTQILKVGHHGSRTSSSYNFIKLAKPEYALISNGRENKYGHPHEATLDVLNQFGAKILQTDLLGTIIVKSDGTMLRWQYEDER